MSLVLSIYVLFISLMQPVNGPQFSVIIFFLLFVFGAVPVFGTVIVPLASIMHHYNHINLTLTPTF